MIVSNIRFFLFVSGNSSDHQHPAEIVLHGDPAKDSDISLKVKANVKTFNLNLQRLNNTLLHEDFKVLNVFTDSQGKTVFHEDSRHVSSQQRKEGRSECLETDMLSKYAAVKELLF